MEPSRRPTQGDVDLGGDEQDRERRRQSHITVDESDAQDERHECGRERREEFQGEAREEGDAQRRHGARSEFVADLAERVGHRHRSIVRLQGRQTAHDVAEVVRQDLLLVPRMVHPLLRLESEEDHEERQQAERAPHDECAPGVRDDHPREQGERRADTEHQRRHVGREVGLDRVDPSRPQLHERVRRDTALAPQHRVQGAHPQGPAHRTREPRRERFAEERQQGSSTGQGDQQAEITAQRPVIVGEQAPQRVRQHHRLGDREDDVANTERDRGGERTAHERRRAHEST